MRKLSYIFNSGKNSKFPYFAKYALSRLVPNCFWRWQRERILKDWEARSDADEIRARVDYYCRFAPTTLPADAPSVHKAMRKDEASTYRVDMHEVARYFPKTRKAFALGGDATEEQPLPHFQKCRRLNLANTNNAVLLNLDKIRHFIFVKDTIPFANKKCIAVFRGKVPGKQLRIDLFEKCLGHPLLDIGDSARRHPAKKEWLRPELTLREQLQDKFIFSLEGNDVASNLKWVMSSNSIAVSAPLAWETWFMEGQLKGGVHYIEIKPDFSDLEEKLRYYNDHPEEAQKIIDAAHAFVDRFRDKKRERIISLLVAQRYFERTGQRA